MAFQATREQDLTCKNDTDADGNPAGGHVTGVGLNIVWQAEPRGDAPLRGAIVIDVLTAAVQRLLFYQASPYASKENAGAIAALEDAISWLHFHGVHKPAPITSGQAELT